MSTHMNNLELERKMLDTFRQSNYYRYLEENKYYYFIDKICKFFGEKRKRARSLKIKTGVNYDVIVDLDYKIINAFYDDFELMERFDKETCRALFSKIIYLDPDEWVEKKCLVNNSEITLSPDGLISAKRLFDLHEGKEAWIKEYDKYRRKAYVFWPKHNVSINQQRYTIFNDRIDYTLFDIKYFYQLRKSNCEDEALKNAVMDQQNGCKLAKAFVKDETFIWLNSFKSFEDFIDSNCEHHKFVEMQNGEYLVLDLEVGNGEIIRNYKNNGYKMNLISLKNYYDNLINLIEK